MNVMRSQSVGGHREGYDRRGERCVFAKTNPISQAERFSRQISRFRVSGGIEFIDENGGGPGAAFEAAKPKR